MGGNWNWIAAEHSVFAEPWLAVFELQGSHRRGLRASNKVQAFVDPLLIYEGLILTDDNKPSRRDRDAQTVLHYVSLYPVSSGVSRVFP
jgi:hypothetical protein